MDELTMLTLYDYLPSQNAWKIRQLLGALDCPYKTELISIFEGEGHADEFLRINPWGAVPAIRLDDDRVLSESSAILWHLGRGTRFLPDDPFQGAKAVQWLSFEIDYVQNSLGSLRYWTLTDKLGARPADMVTGKRATAERALAILDREFAERPFILGDALSIADIALYAYAHLAEDARLDVRGLTHFLAWTERFRSESPFLAEVHPYAIDPHSSGEL
ncbi:glutathione S-transferase family protein [Qipengyuania qiaonensis]|uniref:Glutathione S-transferase family protein n=1 Tax=Qipengyuania qiaonensis TaxID=2867240 RepID=A0ABS7JDT8_9SPHN|nr:glutathione S-transferase family protein [Qipengyuania qiaonensis]MBX7484019.1 glutathione S-transferase family protein [Qipengyuania qiaonensis]